MLTMAVMVFPSLSKDLLSRLVGSTSLSHDLVGIDLMIDTTSPTERGLKWFDLNLIRGVSSAVCQVVAYSPDFIQEEISKFILQLTVLPLRWHWIGFSSAGHIVYNMAIHYIMI